MITRKPNMLKITYKHTYTGSHFCDFERKSIEEKNLEKFPRDALKAEEGHVNG